MKYLGRRLLHSLFILLGVSLLSFLFADLAPGDFYSALRADPRMSRQAVEAIRQRAGANKSFPARYGEWAVSSLHGDFGYSLAFNAPVGPLLWPRLGATLLLTSTATLLAWLAALPLGVWQASRRNRWSSRAVQVVLTFLLAVPDLLLALGALVLALESGLFPLGGIVSRGFAEMSTASQVRDVLRHMALPVSVLALGMLPVLVRHVRAAMSEAMNAPFALSARANGIPQARLLLRHVLPAAMQPLIALFGLSLGTLLSASLLVEVVMGWPGLGPLFLEAVTARDFGVVLAVVMLSTTLLVLGNLTADLLLYRADPRIRAK
jgi:peptide/nickel transport system permease protein